MGWFGIAEKRFQALGQAVGDMGGNGTVGIGSVSDGVVEAQHIHAVVGVRVGDDERHPAWRSPSRFCNAAKLPDPVSIQTDVPSSSSRYPDVGWPGVG